MLLVGKYCNTKISIAILTFVFLIKKAMYRGQKRSALENDERCKKYVKMHLCAMPTSNLNSFLTTSRIVLKYSNYA